MSPRRIPNHPEFFTVAATPEQDVAVVMNYDAYVVKSITMSPEDARALGVEIIAAAARAELPPRQSRILRDPPDRDGMEYADKHDERL